VANWPLHPLGTPGKRTFGRGAQGGTVTAEVADLRKYFAIRRGFPRRVVEELRAVDGVSFDVREGETLGLVGESGSGKTTTAQAILQLVRPTGGSVRFMGTELTTLRRSELRAMRREMQVVFQDPYASLDPRQGCLRSPKSHCEFTAGTRRSRRVHVLELLDPSASTPVSLAAAGSFLTIV
jgi:ABC-type glutathione transport system ATPase component